MLLGWIGKAATNKLHPKISMANEISFVATLIWTSLLITNI